MTPKQKTSEPQIILPGTTVGGEVGTFSVDFVIRNQARTESRSLNGVVDTDKFHTLIPEAILDELEVEREDTGEFTLPDRSERHLSTGAVYMEIEGEDSMIPVPVIFWTDPADVVLGRMALIIFALAADAKHRRLISADLTL